MTSTTTIDIDYPLQKEHITTGYATNSEIKPAVQLVFSGLDEKPVMDIDELAESKNSHLFHAKAHHEGEQVGVVLKLLKYGEIEDDPHKIEVFRQGAEMHQLVSEHAAKLGLNRVAKVYDTGALQGAYVVQGGVKDMHYMLVEYVQGADISGKLKSPDTPFDEKKQLLVQLVEGIMIAHDAGCVHNDVKPENAIECYDHGVKQTDFGIAGQAGKRMKGIVCTPDFAAPEVFFGAVLDPTRDVYALGVSAYMAFEGVHPFKKEGDELPIDWLKREMRPIESADAIALGWDRVIRLCLKKNWMKRIGDGHALLNAIEKL